MNKSSKGASDLIPVAILIFGILLYRIWTYSKPWLAMWYLNNRHIILFTLAVLLFFLFSKLSRKNAEKKEKKRFEDEITNGEKEDSVFAGHSSTGEKVFINLSFRRMHTQIVGTTNAGKTESVIIPWMIDDIEKGRGLIIIDGKSDKSLLNKLYSYAKQHDRIHDVVIFSLSNYGTSFTFNPLINDSVDQVSEKIINSFGIENEYFKAVQFDIFRNVISIFKEVKEDPTFLKIRQALLDPAKLKALADSGKDILLQEWATDFLNMNKDTRREQISGLVSNLGYFTSGEVKNLFNTSKPTVDIGSIMDHGKIAVFQLPVLKSPMLGKAVAKMVLQDIQSHVSSRHASGIEDHPFFSVYLDDFTEYLTKPFVSMLNKSRSANVGVVFAHQAIGDLESLGEEVKNQIQTNANLKIFMRTNEPESTEYFAKCLGTKQGTKETNRQTDGVLGKTTTGDGSVRDVEEFIYHPNVFKRDLGRGEAVVILPHEKGTKSLRLKFQIRKNLKPIAIPYVEKEDAVHLQIAAASSDTETSTQASDGELDFHAASKTTSETKTQTEEAA